MKNLFTQTLSIVLVVILLSSACKKEENLGLTIDPELEYFWNKFIEEANARNFELVVDTTNFSMEFGETTVPAAGQCSSIPGGDVVIDYIIWTELDTTTREQLVFHELGHCLLGRHHPFDGINGELNNLRMFECESLMTASLNGFDCGIDYHAVKWREFYIDELFNVKTVPDWIDEGAMLSNTPFNNGIFEIVGINDFEVTIPFDSISKTDFLLQLNIEGYKDFTFTKNNVQFIFVSNFGKNSNFRK